MCFFMVPALLPLRVESQKPLKVVLPKHTKTKVVRTLHCSSLVHRGCRLDCHCPCAVRYSLLHVKDSASLRAADSHTTWTCWNMVPWVRVVEVLERVLEK